MSEDQPNQEDGADLQIAVIVARAADERVARRLLRGAEDALKRHGAPDPDVFWVPAPLDIAVVALALAEKGGADAIVALGCVIGDDDVVATQATSSLMQVQLDTGVPIALGLLRAENLDEALAGAGPKNNRGADAAEAAVEMANLLREIQG